MIRRIIIVPVQLKRTELWINDDKVFRKSVPSQQAARFARTRRRTIQEVRERGGFAVGNPLVGGRELTQRFRAASVSSNGDRTNRDAVQHRIEQWRVASRSRGVERIKDSIFENIDRV